MDLIPRGGAREVGRSCYHLTTEKRDYLIDCGLKQSHPTSYPDFTGLAPGQIDAVFLTHAHIDHTGALPLCEARGLLADEAPIIATRPTNALAHILLWDSFKLHKMEMAERNQSQRYTEADVRRVLDRFDGVPYGSDTRSSIEYQFGDAGHLLGSAWLVLTHNGQRVLFSGDLGGRSAHLSAIETPPAADTLILESTYGDTHTHRSLGDARTELVEIALDAAQDDIPVLIPTFAIGRAQEILQLFREREAALPDNVAIVYDGMIADSMTVYNVFASDPYVNEPIINYRINSGDTEPFMPDRAWTPETMADRERLLDGEAAPIIIVPSGMLTGGWSPYYLWQLTEHYDDARVLFTGYQAHSTVGRELQDEPTDLATPVVTAVMDPADADDPSAEEFGFHERQLEVPTAWLATIDGLSGHAAANSLLQFARASSADQIQLVHGEASVSEHLRSHLQENTEATSIALATTGEAIEIADTGAVPDGFERLKARQQDLEHELAALRAEIDELEHA